MDLAMKAFRGEFAQMPAHLTAEILRVECLSQDEHIAAMEDRVITLEVAIADANGRAAAQNSDVGVACGVCSDQKRCALILKIIIIIIMLELILIIITTMLKLVICNELALDHIRSQ